MLMEVVKLKMGRKDVLVRDLYHALNEEDKDMNVKKLVLMLDETY